MNKIVYNACFGGFSLSSAAVTRLQELTGRDDISSYTDFERHDPLLVQVVEELGDAASGFCARLRVGSIEGFLYRIDEYDGSESVETPDDIDWVEIK